ncbi:WD domain, G-beta repeat protein [Ostertagia ostertagi]
MFKVPLDFLGLEVPIACTDARYVDDSGTIIEATKVHELRLYDPRAQRRPVKKIPFMNVPITAYKGQAGAIRSIDAHPTAPYVATCGIDRFVRVHDIDTRKLAHKIYCKTRLNRVLLRSEMPSLTTVVEGNDEEWMELKHEPAPKAKRTKSKKRKEGLGVEEESVEPCKKAKIVKGVKRHDEIKEEVGSDVRASKTQKGSEAGSVRFLRRW